MEVTPPQLDALLSLTSLLRTAQDQSIHHKQPSQYLLSVLNSIAESGKQPDTLHTLRMVRLAVGISIHLLLNEFRPSEVTQSCQNIYDRMRIYLNRYGWCSASEREAKRTIQLLPKIIEHSASPPTLTKLWNNAMMEQTVFNAI